MLNVGRKDVAQDNEASMSKAARNVLLRWQMFKAYVCGMEK